jgi:hypothetical protein
MWLKERGPGHFVSVEAANVVIQDGKRGTVKKSIPRRVETATGDSY